MKRLKATIATVSVITSLSACVTAAPDQQVPDHPATAKETYWGPAEAPLLTDLIALRPQSLDAIAILPDQLPVKRVKFESDAEYAARQSAVPDPYFMTTPFSTDETGTCKSAYDHASATYVIEKCGIFSPTKPVLTVQTTGTKLTLANAYQSREIERIVYRTFTVLSNLTWQAKYKISRDEAVKLDSDLMVGMVFSKKSTSGECPICESRNALDSSDDLMDRLAKKNGTVPSPGWKDEALRDGKIAEAWHYAMKPIGISKIVVFRKSDSRVIYEREFTATK